ncbi:hypothetical protein EW146_g3653 [Bondarzewia mesenterica]|uniref:HMG box domain-containing protein n=1 Tax=Bondarzewia mesenterica TaxID=1095465 RepID=A0A4S4M2T2_9AGAM|nr:hypothetical protein EW146_g3653 [Bondarzewia mesenterica]
MPVIRASRRRRSSLAVLAAHHPIKAGKYGFTSPSPKAVTFAPNVTPVSYVEPDPDLSMDAASSTARLFPPAAAPAEPSRKRLPPGKRRSQGYIPRPPNAFMLFRADFVRQKHVPGTIETNHGSLSKIIDRVSALRNVRNIWLAVPVAVQGMILSHVHRTSYLLFDVDFPHSDLRLPIIHDSDIATHLHTGNCWRSLPLEEKRVWEIKAKHAKAEHKVMYPNYRFRPVHNKNKEKKVKVPLPVEDEQRCEDVAQLLLEGMKGDELAAAVKRLDRMRSATPSGPTRRPSSVPLPMNAPGIALPLLHPGTFSRPQSPAASLRLTLPRRPSSAGPAFVRLWEEPFSFAREQSPLPEVNASLFEQAFLDGAFNTLSSSQGPFNFDGFVASLPPNGSPPRSLDFGISPLDHLSVPPDFLPLDPSSSPFPTDPLTWTPDSASSYTTHSEVSSIYSGSPAPSDRSLPLHAPQPQRAYDWTSGDSNISTALEQTFSKVEGADEAALALQAYAYGMQDVGIMDPMSMPVDNGYNHTGFAPTLSSFESLEPFGNVGLDGSMGFNFHDMIHEFN